MIPLFSPADCVAIVRREVIRIESILTAHGAMTPAAANRAAVLLAADTFHADPEKVEYFAGLMADAPIVEGSE